MACGPLPCVARFIAEFVRLSPELRDKAVGEMAGFCSGYLEGREEAQLLCGPIVDDLPTENEETNEVGAKTLAATMTEMDIKPHRGKRGGKAPAPGGWS